MRVFLVEKYRLNMYCKTISIEFFLRFHDGFWETNLRLIMREFTKSHAGRIIFSTSILILFMSEQVSAFVRLGKYLLKVHKDGNLPKGWQHTLLIRCLIMVGMVEWITTTLITNNHVFMTTNMQFSELLLIGPALFTFVWDMVIVWLMIIIQSTGSCHYFHNYWPRCFCKSTWIQFAKKSKVSLGHKVAWLVYTI